MNKYSKEEKEFLNLLEQGNAVADPVFKSRLKNKMLKELEPKSSIFSVLTSGGFSFLAVIVFSFLTVLSGSLILSELLKTQNVKSIPVVSNQIKQEVVEKVTEKTSVAALNLLNVNEFLSTDSIVKPIKEESNTSYNLKTTSVTYMPQASSVVTCTNLNLPKELTVTQLFEYFDEERSVSKLMVNNQTLAVTEFIENKEIPASYPVSYIPLSYTQTRTIDNTNLMSLSDNFEIIENTSNNIKTFTLKDYVAFDCGNQLPASFPLSFPIAMDKIIREFVLNPDYSINKVNLYLNTESVENKIAEITLITTTNNITPEQAEELLTTEELSLF